MTTRADSLQLVLYVAGDAPSSRSASQTLDELLGSDAERRLRLEVVDVLRHPARALDAHLLATPTLIVTEGDKTFRFVGDLDTRRDLKQLIEAYRADLGQSPA